MQVLHWCKPLINVARKSEIQNTELNECYVCVIHHLEYMFISCSNL